MSGAPSSNYVLSRIKEALYNSNGNKAQAMRQVLSWAGTDMQLLQGLTRAHLSGIVAYHVDRAAAGRAGGAGEMRSAGAKKKTPPAEPIARRATPKVGQRRMVSPSQGSPFGQEILKAASNTRSQVFGLESYESPVPAQPTSKRHEDVMRHLASFSNKNKTIN